MKPEETIDFNIRSTWHKISRMYNIQAAEHGVSMATGMVLLNIDLKEGTPSTSLGPKMGMESRSLTRTLKNLEDEKVIYRQADKNDKRMVRIFLTELGIEKRNLSKEKVIKFNTHLMNNIKKKDLAVFFKVMGGINELIDENNIF
ncbi:MAG: DNA-binding MarR family transcriptional regulator [Urechidicola sp.]|mgnify:FL=1|jgi:DNA-binding MarR family transcriptional regulator|tara:strand:- start:689 stop:1123 length:435 start_codon:yes stop_codon:yes gene_type:complete